MLPLFAGPLLDIGKTLIDRLIPDPAAKAAAELDLLKMTQDGTLKEVLAQLEINAREAQSPSVFVSGWRPFFGWVGGAGFGYVVLLQPLLAWLAQSRGWPVPPSLNSDLLWVVITGLLGIAGLRTGEKFGKVASK